MKKKWFSKKIEVLNPYLANFSFNFSFMYKFSSPKFHEFPISHSCRRLETWSNPGPKTKILSVGYLAISFSIEDIVIDQPSTGFHLLVASIILVHQRPTVGKIWGSSALALLTLLGDGFWSGTLSELSYVSLRRWLIHRPRGSPCESNSHTRLGINF